MGGLPGGGSPSFQTLDPSVLSHMKNPPTLPRAVGLKALLGRMPQVTEGAYIGRARAVPTAGNRAEAQELQQQCERGSHMYGSYVAVRSKCKTERSGTQPCGRDPKHEQD